MSGFSQAKSSVIRGIKSRLVDQYPLLSSYIDDIIPKKEPLNIMKWCAYGSCDPWPITIDLAWPTLLLPSRTNKRPVIVQCHKICCTRNQQRLKLLLRCCASESSSIMSVNVTCTQPVCLLYNRTRLSIRSCYSLQINRSLSCLGAV